MTALELISLATQVLFVGLFIIVLRHALRERSRATFDTALLFGSIAGVVVASRIFTAIDLDRDLATPILLLVLNIAPYAMLRLVDDFSGTPRWVPVAGGIAYVAIAALGFLSPTRPQLVEVASIGWFLAVGGYAAIAFFGESARTRGITRRRMQSVGAGAVLFIGAIVLVFVNALMGSDESPLAILTQVAALAAVIAFFLGFAPPPWIRRAWREPELRRFLERSLHLLGVADDRRVLAELQGAAAAAFGASGASIGLSDGERPVLRYTAQDGTWVEYPDDEFIAGRAFREQRRIVALDAATDDPEHASTYRHNGAGTVIAAPLTTEERRIGAIAVYADRAPIFIEDDQWVIGLLADHTAVLLEARDLARQSNALQAREEAARLKEEFLSAAAHDLRTPLTVVLGQAELLERRAARDPSAPADRAGVARIASEARRLRELVSDMLDAQRLEQPGAVMDRATQDLRAIVETVRDRQLGHAAALEVETPPDPVVSSIDRMRMEQVLDNLVENAIKYGKGVLPQIRLWQEDGRARFAVVDHGVGIPEGERERIFDRFYRASNAQSITDTGMGLGLYICRRIVEEHEGRIWIEDTPGGGSTFHVSLPVVPPAVAAPVEVTDRAWAPAPNAEAAADA